jgi:polyhydroxyalkanoate synthesis regulator phasin
MEDSEEESVVRIRNLLRQAKEKEREFKEILEKVIEEVVNHPEIFRKYRLDLRNFTICPIEIGGA